jgi:hypothetical protein|tara:strand:+ start:135 stop:2633 length:2499 start_codon:yes stop_codon:yes gene_type:complete
MTIVIANNNPRVNYTVAQGATQSSFTIPFDFFETDEVKLYVDGVLQSITTHYTISGGSGTTGTITMVSAITGGTGGTKVAVVRDIPIERITNFASGQAISRDALNEQLDTLTALTADLDDRLSRTVQLNDYEVATALTLPVLDTRKGTVLGFNATTGVVEAGPKIADVQSLANITTDIGTLADIEDGTNATNAIQGVASIASNVSTVAGVAGSVTTVAGISSNVTSVAGNSSNINTVAGNNSNISTVAGNNSNISTVAGISSNVTSVAGIASNVTSVAGVASSVTALAATDVLADMAALNTTDVLADLAALGETSVIANMAQLGTASVVSNMAQLGTSSIVADIQALADIEDGTTATDAISTAAANITGINNFSNRYRIGATNPAADNDEGDLFYNTTTDQMLVYNGGAWNLVGQDSATLSIFEFTATASQTAFTGNDSNGLNLNYNTNSFFVALNGVIIPPEDYTATDANTLTLDTGATVGDTLTIYSFSSFSISQPYLGTQIGDVTLSLVNTSLNNERGLQIKSTTDNTTEQPALSLFRDSATPADNDYIGKVGFYGRDSGGNQVEYAKIRTRILETNQANKGAEIEFYAQSASGGYNSMTFDAKNNNLKFGSESKLYWPSHKGTANDCTLDWDTPSQDNTIYLPDANGTISHVAGNGSGNSRRIHTSNVTHVEFQNLSDEYVNHKFYIVAHPANDAVQIEVVFLDSSNSEIISSGHYSWYVNESGTTRSNSSDNAMQISGDSVGNSTHEGYRGEFTLSGLNFASNVQEMPPSIFGNYTMYDSSGNFKAGCFGGSMTIGNDEPIGGVYIKTSAGTFDRLDVAYFGLINNA